MGRRSKTKKRARRKPPARDEQPRDAEPPEARPAFPQQLSLQLLVFTAGAVLMGLEIAGSRVLAPHFGNSVFVWGSLISVVLMALSLGYYLGGRVADRYPSRLLLNSICVAVALSIFGIAFVSKGISAWLVGSGFGEQSGPFAASIVLFLAPSVGMGMVSPFAVRLATRSVSSVGRSAGTLYALSTMGSIAGTLLTTFVLIPLFGLTVILKGLAVVLLLAAAVTMPFREPFWKRPEAIVGGILLVAVTIGCVLRTVPRTRLYPGDQVLLDVDTPYHHITVVDNGDFRDLRFDRYVETTILTTPPYPAADYRGGYIDDFYTDYFHLAFLAKPDIERSLFIGAGGGVGPRTFHVHDPDMKIDVVDIDRKVLDIAHDYFHLERTPQIRTKDEDGRMFVRKAEEPYDCVVLDAFTIGGRIPPHLVTKEFFALCRNRMTEDGVFVMNINSAVDGSLARIFQSMYRTLESVFPHTYVFVKDYRRRGRKQSTNVILVATKQGKPLSPETWTARAERYRSESYVDRGRVQRMVADLLVDVPDVSQSPVFTDDYAPIETMPF